MRRLFATASIGCAAVAVATLSTRAATEPAFAGFTIRGTRAERALEHRLLALPASDRARDVHAFLTDEPHPAGSPRDRVLADWIADRWREYGLERVAVTQHDVLLPYPIDVGVELTAPSPMPLSLREPPIAGDPWSAKDVGPAWHAYSASGDATAPVVYAGSGNPADYDWLAAHGVDVSGKIVLVRYSVPYSYRGFKALVAERHGAAGILIYSDPADDGAGRGRTYPDGPWGPVDHIQRGGIPYDFIVPGDPLTPGWASVPGAHRIPHEAAASLPAIMSVPLSATDARAIIAALQGPVAPSSWQGGLRLAYRVGPGPAAVHMHVRMDDRVRPIWTVTGQITGTRHPDALVIVGNHRDAWVYGGVDPSSGTTSMMEAARALGTLAREGARPARTILFASWDAEEFALTSSTEWGEEHERELTDRAVAYINADSAVSGQNLVATAVPSLNRLIVDAASSIIDPATRAPLAPAIDNRIGSGSDYAVFLEHLGVPIVDVAFTGPYGVYHSIYDDHAWMERFGDPGFRYHAAMARLLGVLALRLADADVLPLDYQTYALRIRDFLAELGGRLSLSDRDLLAPARAALDRLALAADRMAVTSGRLLDRAPAEPDRLDAINRALSGVERALLDPRGIPGRPWYRHLIYAPRPTYAADVLPGLTDAVEAGDRARLAEQAARLADALDRAAARLDREPRLTAPTRDPSTKD